MTALCSGKICTIFPEKGALNFWKACTIALEYSQIVLTTIHAAKGLEWEYVIIPKLNGFAFPNSYMCNSCQDTGSCNRGFDYCEFTYRQTMESKFKEEMSIFYVAITRAKKDVFFTVNTGVNKWNYVKTISCLLNLEGLTSEDYEWENVI